MLRANVGLSRKICREFQSTGVSINLDGEIPFSPDDPEGVLEKVKELYDLAKEAVEREIDREQSRSGPANPPSGQCVATDGERAYSNGQNRTSHPTPSNSNSTNRSTANGPKGNPPANGQSATEKQVQFIRTMGRRTNLSLIDLEALVAKVAGRNCRIEDLTKSEAGKVIDQLTGSSKSPSDRR